MFQKDIKKNALYEKEKFIHKKCFELIDNLYNTTSNYIIVSFDNSIRFIEPFFIIQLLIKQGEYKDKQTKHYTKKLIINVTQLTSTAQASLLRQLKSYVSLGFFTEHNNATPMNCRQIEKSPHTLLPSTLKNGTIIKTPNVKISEEYYKFPPIMKLSNHASELRRNLDEDIKKNRAINPQDSIFDTESLEYKLSIDYKFTYNLFRENIQSFYQKLLENQDYTNNNYHTLSDVIYELLVNVKEHTLHDDLLANAFISFHRNTTTQLDQYEIVISDDYSKGFVQTYKNTLAEELDKLQNQISNESKIVDEIKNSLKTLADDSTESFLKKIFHINNKSTDMLSIRRVFMHFGIPKLIRLVIKNEGTISIFLSDKTSTDEKYYQINIKSLMGEPEVILLNNISFKGTHYHLIFPTNIQDDEQRSISTFLSNQEYVTSVSGNDNLKNFQKRFLPYNELLKKLKIAKTNTTTSLEYGLKADFQKYLDKKGENFSRFFREVIFHAYQNSIIDIILINIKLSDFNSYLSDMLHYIYESNSQNHQVQPLNILMCDSTNTKVFYLGGASGASIKELYNNNITSSTLNDINIKSIFMYDDEIFKNILRNKLEDERIKNIHFDTKLGYHMDNFYKFKNIFSNSEYSQIISKQLIKLIKDKINSNTTDPKICLVATDSYAEFVCSFVYMSRYSLPFDMEEPIILEHDIEKNKEIIDAIELEKYDLILLYTPVTFNGKTLYNNYIDFIQNKIKNKYYLKKTVATKNFKPYNILWHQTISLSSVSSEYGSSTFLNLNLKKDTHYFEANSHEVCTKCEKNDTLTLFELDTIDKFKLQNFYEDSFSYEINVEAEKDQPKKYFKKNSNIFHQKWNNSIEYLHTKRGTNHYTFYIKTLEFLNENESPIRMYLEKITDKVVNFDIPKNKVLILTPQHNSNNRFTALVKNIIFKGCNTTVIQLPLRNHEENYYNIEHIDKLIKEYSDKLKVFFVDDAISSTSTFEYLYSILKKISKNLKFQKAIVIHDRTSDFDNYIEQDFFTDNTGKNIFSFSKINIKPIKTFRDGNNCFLCNRKNNYEEYLKNSLVDMFRYQSATRVVKLKAKHFEDLSPQTLGIQIKNEIKFLALQYIYEYTRDKDCFLEESVDYLPIENQENILSGFTSFEEDFTKDMLHKIYNDYFNNNLEENDLKSLNLFIQQEGNISLLKAFIFPKLVYHKHARIISTIIIVNRLKDEIEKLKNGYQFTYEDNDNIKNPQLQEVMKEYAITNYNYISFLFKLTGYLNIPFTLHEKQILFFQEVSVALKGYNLDNQTSYVKKKFLYTFIQSYLYAVKMLISHDSHNANIFHNNLTLASKTIYKKNPSKDNIDNSLLNLLILLDTHKEKEELDKKNNQLNILQNANNKIEEKLQDIKNVIKSLDVNITLEKLYVNKNFNYATSKQTYEDYLDNSELIDIMDMYFKPIEKNEKKYVSMLYKGATTKHNIDGKILLEHIDAKKSDIYSLWSNMFVEKYPINKDVAKKCTIIKLVSIDYAQLNIENKIDLDSNNPIWYKPLGCLVVSHNNTSDTYDKHIIVTKHLLALQKNLVNIIENEFEHGSIQTTAETLSLKNYLSGYRHGTGTLLDIQQPYDNMISQKILNGATREILLEEDKLFKQYLYGPGKIARIPALKDLKKEEGEIVDVKKFIETEKKHIIECFEAIQIVKDVKDLHRGDFSITTDFKEEMSLSNISEQTFKAILFELCYNASKYCNLANDATCRIDFQYEKGILSISNNRKIKDNIQPTSSKLGLESINAYLSKINYELIVRESESENFIIELKGKENEH